MGSIDGYVFTTHDTTYAAVEALIFLSLKRYHLPMFMLNILQCITGKVYT